MSDAQTPEATLYGSWVEVEEEEELMAEVSRRESLTGPQDSSSSALQGELERVLLEAQLECERYPRAPSHPDTDRVMIQEATQDRRLDTDWVWDWSSRPEHVPLKEFVFQHPRKPGSLSVRKTGVMKSGIFSSDALLILIPSLLASHLLTLGIGVYIGKQLAASTTSAL